MTDHYISPSKHPGYVTRFHSVNSKVPLIGRRAGELKLCRRTAQMNRRERHENLVVSVPAKRGVDMWLLIEQPSSLYRPRSVSRKQSRERHRAERTAPAPSSECRAAGGRAVIPRVVRSVGSGVGRALVFVCVARLMLTVETVTA